VGQIYKIETTIYAWSYRF